MLCMQTCELVSLMSACKHTKHTLGHENTTTGSAGSDCRRVLPRNSPSASNHEEEEAAGSRDVSTTTHRCRDKSYKTTQSVAHWVLQESWWHCCNTRRSMKTRHRSAPTIKAQTCLRDDKMTSNFSQNNFEIRHGNFIDNHETEILFYKKITS